MPTRTQAAPARKLTIILIRGPMRTVPSTGSLAMYVCLCNGVTERDIRQTAAAGCRSVAELTMRTGCGAGCGACLPVASQLLDDAHVERSPADIAHAA